MAKITSMKPKLICESRLGGHSVVVEIGGGKVNCKASVDLIVACT